MLDKFIHALLNRCGVRPGDAVLACCSGGVDSMVLLRLMKAASGELGLKLHAVTVDHGLRCEAPGDARFVLDTCASLGVESSLYELKMDPDVPNLEEAARIRRYEAIYACRKRLGFTFIATGHTADDQAETLIYRLIRGTGIRGMSGMDYARPDGLIRPMLGITRAEIEAYAKTNGVGFVTDQTNSDLTLVRNLIRKRILPLMREVNPIAETAISRFASIAAIENAYMVREARGLIEKALTHDWRICSVFDAAVLEGAHEAVLRRVIIELATGFLGEPRGIPAADVEQAIDTVRGKCRAHTIMRRVKIERGGKHLAFERLEPGLCLSISSPGNGGRYSGVIECDGVYMLEPIGKKLSINGIPAGSNAGIRSPEPGDRIGGERISDIFQDRHIPAALRKYWPVVLLDHEIVSIAGLLDRNGIKTVFPYEG